MCQAIVGTVVFLGLATAMAFTAGAAHADPYRWCAVYGGSIDGGDGGSNCGFVTLEQCRATVSGMGGSCDLNQFYTGPDSSKPVKRARKRHRN